MHKFDVIFFSLAVSGAVSSSTACATKAYNRIVDNVSHQVDSFNLRQSTKVIDNFNSNERFNSKKFSHKV